MKKEFILCLILLFIFIPVLQQGCSLSKNDNYRQISSQLLQWEVIPLPESTINVKNPVHSLNGRWKLNLTPPVGFWKETAKDNDWADIEVPGEPAMQGYEVEHDKEVAYRKEFTIPKEFWGRRIFLRFDGVYSYAKVWVNGRFIREHFGGFTSWDCEITEHVKPGEKAMLTVGVVDRMDDMSYASGYAHHPIGGILRDVSLFCVPENYIKSFDVETELDANYKNAVLKITAELQSAKSAELKLSLNNPSGKKIRLNPNRINFSDKQKKATVEIKIEKPLKWDAEHPYLYTLGMDGAENMNGR